MKYWLKLVMRIIIALVIRPEWFYSFFIFPTMIIPFFVLNIFNYGTQFIWETHSLIANGTTLEFVRACIATSAYYLLALLILTTKDIGIKKTIKMFIVGSLLIFMMNVLRITLLTLVVLNYGLDWFNAVHMIFWYVISTFYVFLVWIFLIRIYKVKNIPLYSDFKQLISMARKK